MRYKTSLLSPLCFLLFFVVTIPAHEVENARRFDGFYNNKNHPEWGSVGEMIVSEYATNNYADHARKISGSQVNPRHVSTRLFRGESGKPSSRYSALFAFFGQLVKQEIVNIDKPGCPVEILSVDVSDDPIFTSSITPEHITKMSLYRCDHVKKTGSYSLNARKQKNSATSWIDGSFIYGTNEVWTDSLRQFKNGALALDEYGKPPRNLKGLPLTNFPAPRTGKLTDPTAFWAVGDADAHSNPGLLALSSLFMKYHNQVAQDYVDTEVPANGNGNVSDQVIFEKTRSKVIAVLQAIAYYEWLPLLLDDPTDLPEYTGAKMCLTPHIDSLYAAVAADWTMTLMPSAIAIKQEHGCGASDHLRLCDWWYDGHSALQNPVQPKIVEELIYGMTDQPAELEDNIITEDLLDYSYGPLHFSRTDAVALKILRGRDLGIGQVDELVYGSNESSWERMEQHLNITMDAMKILKELYGSADQVDMFVLALLERSQQSGPGSIVQRVIKDQLTRVRDADYYWFENTRSGLFSNEEIAEIKRTRLHDVIQKAYDKVNLKEHVFTMSSDPNVCVLSSLNASELGLSACSPLTIYNYFSGNEFAFIISWIWIALFPLVVIGLAYLFYRVKMRRNKQPKQLFSTVTLGLASHTQPISDLFDNQDEHGSDFYECRATEWVGPNEIRSVRVLLSSDKYAIYVQSLSRQSLRSVNLTAYEVMTLFVDVRTPFVVLLEIPKVYDLVLQFNSESQLTRFCKGLNDYFTLHHKMLLRAPSHWREIRRRAITKMKRKERIDSFFRKVFAQAFNTHEMANNDLDSHIYDRNVAEFEISKEEFAESLGMKADSNFVSQMFKVADKRQRGFLQFREILELVIIMSKGTSDRKLELLFDMFDFQKSGSIKRAEVTALVKSLVDLAGSRMGSADLDQLVSEMYSHAGLNDRDELDFEEFKLLLNKEDGNFMDRVNVDWKGVKQPKSKPKKKKKVPAQPANPLFSDHHMERILQSRKSMKAASLPATTDDGSEGSDAESLATISTSVSTIATSRLNGSGSRYPGTKPSIRSMPSLLLMKTQPTSRTKLSPKIAKFVHYMENRKRELTVLFFFYAVCTYLFLERFYFYYAGNEHNGARQTLSLGVAFARGAAEVISFSYSLLLVTMSYNTVRLLRETFLNMYIPFDKNIVFHKIVAWTALFFTAVHSVAYGFNYYFLASGPTIHACFFDTLHYPSNQLIGVAKTLYTSLPGITGVLMILVLIVIFIFASQTTRRYMHNTFWITHKLFIALFAMMGAHGLLWLTQKPNFLWHFIGPSFLYIADKTFSISRAKMKLEIIKADLLPSNVTRVVVKRPTNFEYKSGMWIRISCDALGANEYHPFTLTSAPHEEHISLHVRAVGPWTKNLRKLIGSCNNEHRPLPQVYVDGPFGSGQQDWYNFEVSVLVGAGIGVTPYASILKDFVNMMKTRNRFKIRARKVYFIWSTSDQRSFEWLIDILKEMEEVDTNHTVSTNIFITQFFNRFDLRTSMLYVFEEHAKRIGGRSLFTGLQATTNFGRPNFNEIFTKISEEHLRVKNIGVFSCGPPGLTKGVEQACIKSSAETKALFVHHYENF